MKKGLSNDNNNNRLNYLIKKDKNSNLYEKLNSLYYRINSANTKKTTQKMKYFYFTQNKNKRNNISPISKNPLSAIKPISYEKLFNIKDGNNTNKNNHKKNYPKLMSLKNFKDILNNKIKYNRYNSIINSSQRFTRNHLIQLEKNLSLSLMNNRNETNDNNYKKINTKYRNKSSRCKRLVKSNSQINYNFLKTNKLISKINENFYSKKPKSNFGRIINSGKISTFSNSCDASTNTFDILKNKNSNKSLKNYKRPLMIDYFYSEHKKFCYGFDKLRGKDKYKKPYFIVHKY
jgi:hypothetical protein